MYKPQNILCSPGRARRAQAGNGASAEEEEKGGEPGSSTVVPDSEYQDGYREEVMQNWLRSLDEQDPDESLANEGSTYQDANGYVFVPEQFDFK